MQPRPPTALPLVFLYLLADCAAAQQALREEAVDIQAVIGSIVNVVSVRTGERVVQDLQFKVTRRNNRRPVGAALLVRVRTPGTGPSATFGRGGPHEAEFRTDANGEFQIQGLLSNAIAGSYQIEITVNFTGPDRTHYTGRGTIEMKNLKGGVPGWVKYAALAGAGGVAACLAGPCRPHDSGPSPQPAGPDATISFGAARVGGR